MKMTQLKTLKDMRHPKLKEEFLDRNKLVSIIELKEEAIKWTGKAGWSDFWDWCRKNKGFDYTTKFTPQIKFIEAWIEYFFNLKEEDLK
jgi:hypothetical protein